MNKMSVGQKKAIIIALGVLILVVCFFLIFQKNQDKADTLDKQTQELQQKVNHLSALQTEVNNMQADAETHRSEITEYTQEYPCTVTQQKCIYNIYKMMVDSDVRVTAIRPSDPQKFFENGEFVSLNGNSGTAQKTNDVVSPSAVEEDPEQQVGVSEMVGKYSTYEIDITGSLKQIMKTVDWIKDNDEHMNLTSLSFMYDETTGKLTGTATVNYFELNGNGTAYEDPNVKGITIGTNSIFGVLKEK